MAKPFQPLTNLFLCGSPVVNYFLARAIANTQPASLWLAARFGTLENPVAAPRAVTGFFGLHGVMVSGRYYQSLLQG